MKIAAIWIISAIAFIHVAQAADGCSDGFYGPKCSLKCGQHCRASKCETDADRGTYKCSVGCLDGWTGFTCERKCPKGCNSCDQITGTCPACKTGCCGKNCGPICKKSEPSCRNCKDISCRQCLEGWHGGNCRIPCPTNCESGCNRKSGQCNHQCVKGHHGNYCNKPCTTTCMEGCNQADGSCVGGCHIGWHGRFCNESCSNTCTENKCHQVSGECVRDVLQRPQTLKLSKCKLVRTGGHAVSDCSAGCQAGWRGAGCDQKCPEECYSCSRTPDGRMCIYRREVMAVHTYGSDIDETGRLELRTIFALLLVIPPFLIVGVVQVINICWERYKRRREMKRAPESYELCPDKTSKEIV